MVSIKRQMTVKEPELIDTTDGKQGQEMPANLTEITKIGDLEFSSNTKNQVSPLVNDDVLFSLATPNTFGL
jgi:hypothetical protein